MTLTARGKQIPLKFVDNSNFGRYTKISSEKTYNMFISDGFLVDFFGWKKIGEWPETSGKGRGSFASARSNSLIMVIGSAVIQINASLVSRFIGNLKTSIGLLTFDENLSGQICICDGVDAYIFNTNTLSLTPQNMRDNIGFIPNTVTFHDTYFIFGNADYTSNGSKYYVFKYSTPTTIEYVSSPALQTKPDFALAAKRIPSGGKNILVFGKTVTEVQTDVGAASVNIYQAVSSFSIDYGVASVDTIAANDKIVVWLGINEFNAPAIVMYMTGGYKVLTQTDKSGNDRTDGISYLIENVNNPSVAFGYMLRRDGHLFYVLSFPDALDNFTVAYDFKNDGFIFLTDQNANFFPPASVSYFNKGTYFTSYINNGIYELSTKYSTYNENIIANIEEKNYFIPRYRVCDNIRFPDSSKFIANLLRLTMQNGNDPSFTFLKSIENVIFITNEDGDILTSETGVPLVTEESVTELPYVPRVDMTWSLDGGITWGSYISQDLRFSAFNQSVLQWTNIGACNDIVIKFAFWTKAHVIAASAILEIKQ